MGLTLPKQPGFSDLPTSVLVAGAYAVGRHLAAIKNNADFGMVYPEFFQTTQVHGDTVPVPVSSVDGYKYSRDELVYIWSVQTTASPKSGWETGPGSLWFAQWFVNQSTGLVTSEEYYRDSGGSKTAKTNDGQLLVTTVAIRRKGSLTTSAIIPTYVNVEDAALGTDQPYAETRLKHLCNNSKFSVVASEVIYMGQFGNGDTVPTPISPVDLYPYSYSEVVQFHYSWVWTPPRSAYATPLTSSGKPQNQLGRLEASVDKTTGAVSTTVVYYNDGEITTNDGLLAVFAFVRRKFATGIPCTSTGAALDLGTGADGAVVFDGVNPVPHTTLLVGVYTLTADINATDATILSGVVVKEANWEIKCTGHFDHQLGALLHNNGTNGVNGGDGFTSGFTISGGAGGTPQGNTTNPSSPGSLLSVAPGNASGGGQGAICGNSSGVDSTAPTDGHTSPVGGTSGAGVTTTCTDNVGGESGPFVPTYQGGAGGGAGARRTFGQSGCGGGGASAGSDAGPVKVRAARMTIAGIIQANGGREANGGNASNASSGSGGGGGGGSRGGRRGSITLVCGLAPTITGTVEAIGYDTVLGAGGAHGLGDGALCSHDGTDGNLAGGVAQDGGFALVMDACVDVGGAPLDGTSYAWFDELLLSAGKPVRTDLAVQINKNIQEAVLRPEFFDAGLFSDGGTVPAPTGVDGYVYTRAECAYLFEWADTGAETSGNIRICTTSASVDPNTGAVSVSRYALLDGGSHVRLVNNGQIRVTTVATRGGTASAIVAPTSSTGTSGGGLDSSGGGSGGSVPTSFNSDTQTVANEWTDVNATGVYSYSQQPAFSGSGKAQGISVDSGAGNAAGILGTRQPCDASDIALLMFRAIASVSITAGFFYKLKLWNSDLSSSATIQLFSGALGTSTQQTEIALKIPASADTQVWTDVGILTIGAVGFAPAFYALEFDVSAPSATTTVTIGDVVARIVDDARTLQRQPYVYAADTGVANAYSVALTPAVTAYVPGQEVTFKAAFANTGASTLNAGATAAAIKKINEGALIDLEVGDIAPGQLVTVKYDGSVWQMPAAKPTRYRRLSFSCGVSGVGVVALPARVDFAGTIVGWSVYVDAGTISVDVCKKAGSPPPAAPSTPNTTTDKISAVAPIQVSSGTSASAAAAGVSTWNTSVAQWDSFLLNISAASGVTKVQGEILIQQS